MEESIEEIKLLLKELNFTPETIKSVKIVGNYSLNRNDVSAQVIDWVFHFLEEKCPYNLAVAIAKETAKQIMENISEQQLKEDNINQGKSLNSLTLYSETMKKLGFVCEQFASEIALNKLDTFRSPFKSSVFAIKNKRRKMEDRHVIHSDLNLLLDVKNAPTHSFYAVYDGHSGVDAASFASAHLHINIANHPDFLTDPRLAILEGYKITDVNFSRMCVEENIRSGTTAICALIRESTLFLSWVGDSQAVLVKEGKPVIVTSPHKPDREDERTRIEDLGGHITFMGTWRVNGMLAVTRALGDFDHRPYVSNEPEISVQELDGTEDFLILACDGLWDGMSPEDVIPALYHNLLERAVDEPLDTVAAKLVHQSKLQGSEDNITVIVVFLRDINIIKENAAKYVPNLSKANLSQNIFELNGEEKGCMEGVFNSQIQKPTVLELNNSSMKKLKNAANVLSAAGIGDSLTYSFSENSECSSYPNMEINSEQSAAFIAPETTALSELPTPPIDDVLASQQFEKELDSAVYDSDASLSKISSNVVSSSDCDMKELSQSEEFEFSQKETILQEEKLSPKEALDLASDVVSSTIETAVKCVSEKETTETSLHVTTQKLNPYAEPFVMKSFILGNFNSSDSDYHSDLTISPKPTQAQFELKSEISELSDVSTILLSENKEQSAVEDHSNVNIDSEANIINIKDSVESQCQLIDTNDKASFESSKSDINKPIPETSGIEFDFHKSAETNTLEETLAGSTMSPASETAEITDAFSALSLSTKDGDFSFCLDSNKTEEQIGMKYSDEISTNQIENLIATKSAFISDVEPMDIDVPEEKSSENVEDLVYTSTIVDKDVSTQEEMLKNEANKNAENTVVETIKNAASDIENTSIQTTSLIGEKNLDYTNEITANLMNLSETLETGNNVIESSTSLKEEISLNFANENIESSLNNSQTIKNVTVDINAIGEPISLIDEKSPYFSGDNVSSSLTVSENIEKETSDESTNINSASLMEQKLLDFSMEEKCFNVDQNIDNDAPNKNIMKVDDQNEEMLLNYANENMDHLINISEVIENKVTNKNIANVEGQNIAKLSDANENTENLANVSGVIESKAIIDENIILSNVDKDDSFFNLKPESKIEDTSLNVLTADNLIENNSFLSVSEMEQDGSFLSDLIADTNEVSFKLKETLNDITSFSESANGLVPDPSVILKEMSLPLADIKDNLLSPAAILPSDHSDEVAIEPVAVDLQSIPVGVPEAEGVTEDIDSDSEKDGGWSYMKGNTIGGVKQKVAASKSKVGKYGTKMDTVKPKEMPKAANESKIKVKLASNIDKAKKVPLEKKLPDNKEKTKLTKAIPPSTSTKVTVEKQSKIMQAGIKKDIPTSKVSALVTNKVLRAPIAPRNPPTQVKSASVMHTNRTQPISKPLSTTATARPKPNIDTKTSATSSLPKKQLPTQTIKSTVTSARTTVKHSATATVPPKATSTVSTLQKATSAEAKTKPSTTSLKRTLPPALKKPDIKETKDLSNKQISEKKNNSLPKTSKAALPTSTTSSLRSTIPSSNAKPISKPRSAPLRNETLKKDVPKTQISRLATKSSTQSKLTKDSIKSKDKISAAGPNKKLVEKESKVAPTEKSEIVPPPPPSEEEKFLREVNDKEIPSKEQVDSAVGSIQEPEKMQNGCVAENESREAEIISSPMETLL